MKIGIISEFKIDTVNYGNNLQAYALNRYLRETFPEYVVQTLHFRNNEKHAITSYLALLRRKAGQIWWKINGKSSVNVLDKSLVGVRLLAFHEFQKANIVLSDHEMTWDSLLKSDYDLLIVGSDVVWSQSKAFINRIKFLDFENRKNATKVAYAASFGQNVIPRENKRAIRKALESFKAISVRESSTVELLYSIGVKNAVQTADPTLLLSKQEWSLLECLPGEFELDVPFIFAYFLGANEEQAKLIRKIGKAQSLPIVYVPYASGGKDKNDVVIGDIAVPACSPGEWLWLIHHAEFVLTDSFHGVVLSTVYEKKFIVLKRNYIRDINIRLTDYLSLIGQENKIVDSADDVYLDALEWDYKVIDSKLEELRIFSKAFLTCACQDEKIGLDKGQSSKRGLRQ